MAIPLYIDEDALAKAHTDYSDQASRMTTLKDTLTKSIDEIRSGWQSNGGTEFFKKYDDEWLKNLKDYIDVIHHMAENMDHSIKKYDEIFDVADQIRLR